MGDTALMLLTMCECDASSDSSALHRLADGLDDDADAAAGRLADMVMTT